MKLGKLYPDMFRTLKLALKETKKRKRKAAEVDKAWKVRTRGQHAIRS